MPSSERKRYYPAVGPAIPRRRTSCSRVTHPSATEPELPPVPFDLHVLGTPPAFVLSQDQTLQCLKNPNSPCERLRFVCRPYITSESNPRDARLTARRSNGSALHTLDHQFSKSHAQKVPAQTPILTGCPDTSQGGLLTEDTAPPPPPSPTHPNGLLAEAHRPCHIATHGALARRSPTQHGSPRAHGPSPRRHDRRGRTAVRCRAARPTRAPRAPERRRAHPPSPGGAHQRRRVGHPR